MSFTLQLRTSIAVKTIIMRKNVAYLSCTACTQKCHLSNVKMTFNDMAYFLLFKLKTLRCGVYDRVYIKGVAGLYLPLCRSKNLENKHQNSSCLHIIPESLFYREFKLLALLYLCTIESRFSAVFGESNQSRSKCISQISQEKSFNLQKVRIWVHASLS